MGARRVRGPAGGGRARGEAPDVPGALVHHLRPPIAPLRRVRAHGPWPALRSVSTVGRPSTSSWRSSGAGDGPERGGPGDAGDGDPVAVHLHLDLSSADRDEVLHEARSSTATVSTCAVWGNRSNARTSGAGSPAAVRGPAPGWRDRRRCRRSGWAPPRRGRPLTRSSMPVRGGLVMTRSGARSSPDHVLHPTGVPRAPRGPRASASATARAVRLDALHRGAGTARAAGGLPDAGVEVPDLAAGDVPDCGDRVGARRGPPWRDAPVRTPWRETAARAGHGARLLALRLPPRGGGDAPRLHGLGQRPAAPGPPSR